MSKLTPTPKERNAATLELRKKHQPIFDALSIPDARFIPKMAHHVKDLNGLHMGFFDSELNHGQDVYTEMVSIMMESEDPSRTLYKYRYNPHYKTELATVEGAASSTRYYIPLDELEVVEMPDVPVKRGRGRPRKSTTDIAANKVTVFREPIRTVVTESDDEVEDQLMEKMTIRDYIAIHTGNPVSTKSWINKIVTKNYRV